MALFLLGGWLTVLALTSLTGPYRPGFVSQLEASPRFLFEMILGVSISAIAGLGAIRISLPGASSATQLVGLPAAALLVWTGLYVYGLESPALEPSMLGKREHCFYETGLFALPAIIGLFLLFRRRLAINRVCAGLLIGVGATSMPAAIMQIACMYEPWHVLTHHIAPVALLGVVCALAASRILPHP